MTTTAEYLAAEKVNGWVIDQKGRTDELCWRCWRLDEGNPFNNRQKSFATKEEAIRYATDHN
jgi:hypothetical protein